MIQHLYFALIFLMYQSNYCIEPDIEAPVIIHVSNSDESFTRSIKKKYNTLGAWLGKHARKIREKSNIDLGFGDTYEAQKILEKHDRTINEQNSLFMHINRMDAGEKTDACNQAFLNARNPKQVIKDAHQIVSNQEVIEQHSDGTITVHDLGTFGSSSRMTQKKFDIATNIIQQYLQDPMNHDLEINAKKILNSTSYLRVATHTELARLIPDYFKLSKLVTDPKKFKDRLFFNNKLNPNTKQLVQATLEKYFEDENSNPADCLDLLDMYNDTEKTAFLSPYFNNNSYEHQIMKLIGHDFIIVDKVICNIHTPTFKSDQQAIDVATKLCDKENLTNAQKTALRNILQKMSYTHRAIVLEKYSKKSLETILHAIQKEGEFILNDQIINSINPGDSLYTQNPDDFAISTIMSLLRTTPRSNEQDTALQNFTTVNYRQNALIIAKIIDQLLPNETNKINEIQTLLPKETIVIIHPPVPTILINPQTLTLATSITQQAKDILEKMDIDPTHTQAIKIIRRAIAQHFKTKFKIVDITSAQTTCERLLYINQDFEPDIFQAILSELGSPKNEQILFFKQIINTLTNQAHNVRDIIDQAPEEYQENYGIAGGSMIKIGIEKEMSEIEYIGRMMPKFDKLIDQKSMHYSK